MASKLKRKTPTHSTTLPKKRSKAETVSSSVNGSGKLQFNARVVPSTYKAKAHEVVKTFDEVAAEQSLVSQARDFFQTASRICIQNGRDWESMNRFKSAVYMSTTFAVGADVLIKQDETNDEDSGLPAEMKGRWVGRIIEIRALDGDNVFILVNWYLRPEDLPKGRQVHHSMNEVLASNDVDIIGPTSLESKFDVEHWVESDDTAPPDRTIFWRQCVAMEGPGGPKFSKLKTVCVCDGPTNPDKVLINCEQCNSWLHDECLVAALAKQEGVSEKNWKRVIEADESGSSPDVLPKVFKMTPKNGKSWVVEMQDEEGEFIAKNRGGKKWVKKMQCLRCQAAL